MGRAKTTSSTMDCQQQIELIKIVVIANSCVVVQWKKNPRRVASSSSGPINRLSNCKIGQWITSQITLQSYSIAFLVCRIIEAFQCLFARFPHPQRPPTPPSHNTFLFAFESTWKRKVKFIKYCSILFCLFSCMAFGSIWYIFRDQNRPWSGGNAICNIPAMACSKFANYNETKWPKCTREYII